MEGKLVTSAGTASEDVRGSSSVCVISDFEGWSVWDGWLGTVSGVVSDTLESKLVRPRSGLNAGLAARDGNSEEALLDPGLSAPFTTAFASRSCSLVLGLLLDEFRDNPKLSISPVQELQSTNAIISQFRPAYLAPVATSLSLRLPFRW